MELKSFNPLLNIAYGFNLNSNINSYNAFIGIYLYDSLGIKIPNNPLIKGIQNVYFVTSIKEPNYPLYVVY